MIACVPGQYNNFDGYEVIVQVTTNKINTGLVLFENFLFNPELRSIDADCIEMPCFVVKSNINKGIVALAEERENWPMYFTNC